MTISTAAREVGIVPIRDGHKVAVVRADDGRVEVHQIRPDETRIMTYSREVAAEIGGLMVLAAGMHPAIKPPSPARPAPEPEPEQQFERPAPWPSQERAPRKRAATPLPPAPKAPPVKLTTELAREAGSTGRHAKPPASIENAGVVVSFEANTVAFEGKSRGLPGRVVEIVAALSRAMPEILPTDVLIQKVWGRTAPSSANMMVSIAIRESKTQLEEIGLRISSLRGFGYRLHPIRQDEEETA